MTLEEATAKAELKAGQLTEEKGVKVHPMVFLVDETDFVIGYLAEPNRMTKIRVMDKAMQSPITAASELLEACIIEEASDSRIMGKSGDDKFYLGATMEAYNLVVLAVNAYKKK